MHKYSLSWNLGMRQLRVQPNCDMVAGLTVMCQCYCIEAGAWSCVWHRSGLLLSFRNGKATQ